MNLVLQKLDILFHLDNINVYKKLNYLNQTNINLTIDFELMEILIQISL